MSDSNDYQHDGFCDDCREFLNLDNATEEQSISLEEMDKLWEEDDNEEMYQLPILLEQAFSAETIYKLERQSTS